MNAQKLLAIILAMAGTAVSLKCYVNNPDNNGAVNLPESSSYENCPDDEPRDNYRRACRKITREGGVVNKGCGWQRPNWDKYMFGGKPDIINSILNFQMDPREQRDVDLCSEDIDECVGCKGNDGKNLNDLCKNAIERRYKQESQADCLKRLKEEKVLSVCFCSTDYCNSGNYLKSSLFLLFIILMKPLFI